MSIAIRRSGMIAALLAGAACAATIASAQADPDQPVTFLDRQLARTDLAVSGVGQFTKNTSGTNYLNQDVSLQPSNTLGALVTLRFVKSPWIGAEINYGYARYTENFTVTNTASTPVNTASYVLGIQSQASEYTAGYLVHSPNEYYGVHPFASVGIGAIEFKPTSGGGQGLPNEAVKAYYYSVGAESLVLGSEHFGLRGGFRQSFYLKPDFFQNYLTDQKRSFSSEPFFGFFLRF